MMRVAILLLSLTCDITSGVLLDSVYVDALKGTNSKSCGGNRVYPCKDFSVGVQRVKSFGSVFVIGKQHVNASVILRRNITIATDKIKQGILTFDTTKHLQVDFILSSDPVKEIRVNISGLHFYYTFIRYIGKAKRSSITIQNSVFIVSEKMDMRDVNAVIIQNCTFLRPKMALNVTKSSSVTIKECQFVGSESESFHSTFICTMDTHTLQITGCSFSNGRYNPAGGCVFANQVHFVTIEESKFEKCSSLQMGRGFGSGGAVFIFATADRKFYSTYKIRRCMFLRNFADYGGAVFIEANSQRSSQGYPYNRVYITSSKFHDNKATKSGQAIFSKEVTRSFSDIAITCTNDEKADHINIVGEWMTVKNMNITLYTSGSIQGSMIKDVIRFRIKYDSIEKTFNHTCFEVDKVHMTCPEHFNAVVTEFVFSKTSEGLTVPFIVKCKSCPTNEYTLATGGLTIHRQRDTSDPLATHTFDTLTNGQCVQCPVGATCDGDIKPIDNYWSYVTSTNHLHFIQCPNDFCCSRQSFPCTSYDSCNIGRTGKLCGSCHDGYSQSFGSIGCVRKSGVACNIYIFVIYFIGLSLMYTVVFVFSPCIIASVKNVIVLKRQVSDTAVNEHEVKDDIVMHIRTNTQNLNIDSRHDMTETNAMENENNKGMVILSKTSTENLINESPYYMAECHFRENGDEGTIAVRTRTSVTKPENECSDQQALPISAYITVVCFFFQAASLVHVKIHTQNASHGKTPNSAESKNIFLELFFDFFNFRVSVYRKVCPMDNMTLPIKESINICLKLCSMLNLWLIYLIVKYIAFLKTCVSSSKLTKNGFAHPANPEAKIEGDQGVDHATNDEGPKLSFKSITKIGFIKLVKLNFTSLSSFTFYMVHCVEINDNLHLYLYGDLQCYTWWQQLILFVLLPIMVLYPLSFGLALDLLKERLISPSAFLVASVMPFFTLALYLKKRIIGLDAYHGSEEDEKCTDEILAMEEELYVDYGNALRWPVVQLYRNLLVVVLNIFVINSIYRSIALLPVFLAFTVHDCYRVPYKHAYLNYLQTLSSASLLIINACNNPASFSTVFDLSKVPAMEGVLTALKYIEFVVLAAVPLSFVVWKILPYQIKYPSNKDLSSLKSLTRSNKRVNHSRRNTIQSLGSLF